MFLVARHDHFESVELRGAPKFAHGHDHDVLFIRTKAVLSESKAT